jgi:hypothetical protein
MSIGFTTVDVTPDYDQAVEKRNLSGDWEIRSRGNGGHPGMAAVSAITTLQVGATLTDDEEDKIAMTKAAEYLIRTLAPQLKNFQRELSAS